MCFAKHLCIRNLVNFKMEAGLSSNTCHMYPYANDMRYRCGVLFSFICFRVLPEPLIQISKPGSTLFLRKYYLKKKPDDTTAEFPVIPVTSSVCPQCEGYGWMTRK